MTKRNPSQPESKPDHLNPSVNGPPAVPDPFDADNLRMQPEDVASCGVEKVLLNIPHEKPKRTWFVRTHPDPKYRIVTKWIDLGDRGGQYLVARHLWPALAAETALRDILLVTSINKQNVLFLWPMSLPTDDGRNKQWSDTGMECIERAKESWVRVNANLSAGGYELFVAKGAIGDPVWPKKTLTELLAVSFKDHHITTLDHTILRRLRGEV
jgi:hypothetical protein